MKKLFVCAMALAAFVSCSKDEIEGPALDSANKTVQITIANATADTRAGESGVTKTAGEGTTVMSAQASELKVLFSDGTKVLHVADLAAAEDEVHDDNVEVGQYTEGNTGVDGTYIWHNVPWNVTQISVVRLQDTDITITEGTTLLADVAKLATDETLNLARPLETIVLYGTNTLTDTGATHRIGDIVYHIWNADVTVKPQLARFEVTSLTCTDLGEANKVANDATYGFDELVVKGLKWRSTASAESTYPYTATNFAGKLYGSWVPTATDFKYADPNTDGGKARSNSMDAGKDSNNKQLSWSWNIAAETTFDEMIIDLDAYAYGYVIPAERRAVPLQIIDLEGAITNNKFEAGNIYTLDIPFKEENIIDPEGLCVTVKVTIVDWKINVVTPVFGKPAATPAQ